MPADDEVRKDLSGVSVRVSHGIFWGNFASREEQQEGAERGMHSLACFGNSNKPVGLESQLVCINTCVTVEKCIGEDFRVVVVPSGHCSPTGDG